MDENSFAPPDRPQDGGSQESAPHQPEPGQAVRQETDQQETALSPEQGSDFGAAAMQETGAFPLAVPDRAQQDPATVGAPGAVATDFESATGQAAASGDNSPGSASPKRRSRGLVITAVGASYLLLAAGTAAAVVAVASPAPVDVAALSSASAGTGGGASGAPSSSTRASAASASASPSPSPSPSPSSTVAGSVKDGVHSGDLRYFLLPPPDGPSSVHGDPDGTTESTSDVVTEYGGSSDVKSYLSQMNFKTGARRTYQDSTLGANVSIELLQFGSSGDADSWLQGFELSGDGWTSFSVSGESGASAREKNSDGLDELVGAYAEGDTFYQVRIFGTGTLPHSDLSDLMKAEHGRLAHG